MNSIKKLALGTVQFGLNYGINNVDGQVSNSEIEKILQIAKQSGVDTIDTAYAYGESEKKLGQNSLSDFKIVSKLPPCNATEVKSFFEESICRLNVNGLYAYMVHNFSAYQKDKKIWEELVAIRKKGLVQKIGFSLYDPDELHQLWNIGIEPDIVQVPYNLFDRRFEKVFEELKNKHVEIHTRSTFLQGLFFKSIDKIPLHFLSIQEKLIKLNEYCEQYNSTIANTCIGFVQSNSYIDKVVIGLDKKEHLEESISTFNSCNELSFSEIDLQVDDLNIINPSLWKT